MENKVNETNERKKAHERKPKKNEKKMDRKKHSRKRGKTEQHKGEKQKSYLVEVVVDAMVICRTL